VQRGVARCGAASMSLELRIEANGEGAFPVRHDATPPPRMSHRLKVRGRCRVRAQYPAAGAAPGDTAFAGEIPPLRPL